MRFIVFAVLVCSMVVSYNDAEAQVHKPVKWHFSTVPLNNREVKLVFTANLEDGWHIYSQHLDEGGPLPTTFRLEPSKDYEPVKTISEESTPVKSYDQTFMMDIVWFEKTAVFTQTVKLLVPVTTIKGKVEFMACREELCLPPDDVEFSVEVKTPGNTGKSKSK